MAKKKKSTKKKDIMKEKKAKAKTFKAVLAGERVFSNAKEAKDLYGRSHFGEHIEGKVYYSLVEALYLLEAKKIEVYDGKKKMGHEAFVEKARKLESNFWTRY